ncbi:MAG: tetratricopeptide repeat protein [Candidatus Eisenbacteria bacterium]|nr:tetratricopeptide repeat protein [Candidatus Eisenbacteria bacterium]
MRLRLLLSAALLAASTAAPAFASFSGGSSPRPDNPTPGGETGSAQALTPRQQAERFYGDAYDAVAKAKQDLEAGREKNARKKLGRALDRARQAAELDSTYHEAWNLIGYASRRLGDYAGALAAYERCLRLKPDYAPAREYLGEAYVELGNVAKALEQLVALERLGSGDDARILRAAIEAYEAAHPAGAATPAKADSAAAGAVPRSGQ